MRRLFPLMLLMPSLISVHSLLFSQRRMPDVIVIPISEEKLHPCIYNRVVVFARQQSPIHVKDVNAKLIISYGANGNSMLESYEREIIVEETGENEFLLKGIDTLGSVRFEIELEDDTAHVDVEVYPLKVQFYLGRTELSDKVIRLEALKNALGIAGRIDFEGLDAYGKIHGFKIIVFRKSIGKVIEIYNNDQKFIDDAKELIGQLESGDWITFTDIKYSAGCDTAGKQVADRDYMLWVE